MKQASGSTDPDPLPPLQAPPGVTALSGRVLLAATGKALEGVTLEVVCQGQESEVRTDATGRFLLAPLAAGRCKLEIDAEAAGRPARNYGLYFVGVEVTAGRTNVLPYYIWLTEIDRQHAVRIPSPTATEVVVSTPTGFRQSNLLKTLGRIQRWTFG